VLCWFRSGSVVTCLRVKSGVAVHRFHPSFIVVCSFRGESEFECNVLFESSRKRKYRLPGVSQSVMSVCCWLLMAQSVTAERLPVR